MLFLLHSFDNLRNKKQMRIRKATVSYSPYTAKKEQRKPRRRTLKHILRSLQAVHQPIRDTARARRIKHGRSASGGSSCSPLEIAILRYFFSSLFLFSHVCNFYESSEFFNLFFFFNLFILLRYHELVWEEPWIAAVFCTDASRSFIDQRFSFRLCWASTIGRLDSLCASPSSWEMQSRDSGRETKKDEKKRKQKKKKKKEKKDGTKPTYYVIWQRQATPAERSAADAITEDDHI